MSDVHKNYLFDLGHLLKEEALKAKDAASAARGTDDEAFQSGRAYAFYEIMSLLVGQAESFQLAIEDLHLEGLDPDRDLLDGDTGGV
jgi:hypothetical protein